MTTRPAPRPPIHNLDRKIAVHRALTQHLTPYMRPDNLTHVLPRLLDALEPHLRHPPTDWSINDPPPTPTPTPLTPRMLDVLHALAHGHSSAQAAAQLHLAEVTVRRHHRRLYAALGVHTAAHAVARGYQLGILR